MSFQGQIKVFLEKSDDEYPNKREHGLGGLQREDDIKSSVVSEKQHR